MWLLFVGICSLAIAAGSAASPCVARDYGYGSVVCVCNATYCDNVEPSTVDQLTGRYVRHYVSSKAGRRLEPMTMMFSTTPSSQGNTPTFTVDRNTKYQTMLGFGGSATDANGINTYALSAKTAEQVIRSYFSDDGIGYTFIRVPVGGSDFSTHNYAYDEEHPGDVDLTYFNLTAEDYDYKIPFIKKAEEVSPNKVKLLSSPWTAPNWMKNINSTNNASNLKEEYYQVYASYYIKFLDAYAAEGLDFWGLTPQNEPSHGLLYGNWTSMGWTSEQMENFLAGDLCPALRNSAHRGINVMINDDQRSDVPQWMRLYENATVRECVSGTAVHWYLDNSTSPSILTEAHEQRDDKFLLYTEACVEKKYTPLPVTLGYWDNAVRYISDIIEVTNSWVTGWIDWNMVLDLQGGPNWANNQVDAPVIVNATADEFYKQPMFYAVAHFSAFVKPGSVRIGLRAELAGSDIQSVAFLAPGNVTTVILHNRGDTATEAVLSDPKKGSVNLQIPANSFHTILYI